MLGAEPRAAWAAASAGAVRAVGEEGAMDRIVHLSLGDSAGGPDARAAARDAAPFWLTAANVL